MTVLEYTGLGLLLLALVSVIVLMPKVPVGVRFWLWGWAAQIFTGPLQVVSADQPFFAFFAHGLSTLFPVLLLAGTYSFVEREVPRWVFYGGASVALVRGLLASLGLYTMGRVLTLPAEVLAYAWAAWLIADGRLPRDLRTALLVFGFTALIGVEIWDAFYNDPSRSSPIDALPWVVVLVAAGSIQLYAWLDKHRNESSAAQRSAEDRFEALVTHASDVIAEINSAGRVAFVSPNCDAMLGYSQDKLTGLKLDDLIEMTRAEQDGKGFRFADPSSLGTIAEQGPYPHLYKIRHADGTSRHLEISASNYLNAEGQLRAVAVVRDVTERKEAEQLSLSRQKLESLGTMSAGIAHDFRNLLTAIRGSTELLQLDMHSATLDDVDHHFSNILSAVDQASGLTDQLLTYAGKTPVDLQPLDTYETLAGIQPLLKSAIADRAHLTIDLTPNLPRVSGNTVAIQQMLINLVTNAVEAMPNNSGQIRISTREAVSGVGQKVVQIAVADNGEGMDEVTKAHIFEPFYSTKFAGRGLGLAALQGLVTAHGGSIKVDSIPGEGSTFTISLPALDERQTNG